MRWPACQLVSAWNVFCKFYRFINMSTGQPYVVGYYNANGFPINISVPELNGSIQLEAGSFIKTKAGVKINDPIFERYCGPNRLQRETSRDKVPLIKVPQAKVEPNVSSPGFTGVSQHVEKRPKGPVVKPDTGVMAFSSIEEAEKAGFLRRASMVPESPVQESANSVTGVDAPTIEYADQDVPDRPEIKGTEMASTVITIPAGPKESAKLNVVSNNLALPKPELPPELAVTGPIVEVEQISGFRSETQVEKVHASPQLVPSNLPDPQVTETSPPVKVESEEAKSKKTFGCPRCSDDPKTQNYRFRSQLSDHVRRKHSEDYDAIMATIPK